MATAEELLRSLTTQPDPEGHIVVGGDRFIKVPDNLKRLGVQYDHNMETVTFDCPRYWDNRDMSTPDMVVYINYALSDGYTGRYTADNVRADGDIMHFEWTISKNVTQTAGKVSFLVCVMKTDSEGIEEHHWNSELCQDCYISPGMETEENSFDMYPDETTQLLERMASVEQINVQAEEMQTLYENTQAVAATAEEVKNQALDASGYIKNSYAPAIKGNVYGEIVRVDDVSPIEHDVQCWVHGKNLLRLGDTSGTLTNSDGMNLEASIESGYLTLNGTFNAGPPKGKAFYTDFTMNPVNYIPYASIKQELSVKIPRGEYAFSANETMTEGVDQISGGYIVVGELGGSNVNGTAMYYRDGDTFTVDSDDYYAMFVVYLYGSNQIENFAYTARPQLERGLVTTEYEPWLDPTTVSVTGCGKNILQLSGNKTQNGVTMTVGTNDLITVKGTSTSSININVGKGFMKAGYKYRPVITKLKSDMTPSFWSFVSQANMHKDKDGYLSTDADTEFSAFIYAAAAGTVYDAVFRIMVELVTDDMTDEYESYNGIKNVAVAEDGISIVPSVSPNMTLFTDTPGALIEVEYNRDTTKMFESYVLTDEAKAEIVGLVENDMAEVLASLNDYATNLIENIEAMT